MHNITNDDNDDYDDVYMMWILVSSSFLMCEYLKTVHVKGLCCTSMTDAFTLFIQGILAVRSSRA